MLFPFTIHNEDDFRAHFPDEASCIKYLKVTKWPNGFVCPVCGNHEAYELQTRRLFQCTICRHQTSLIANTVMQDTKLPVLKWFLAIFLVCTNMDGVTAKALERRLEVQYKTAWHLLHRIREGLANPLSFIPLEGQVISSAVPFTDVVNTTAWRAAGREDEPVVAVMAEHNDHSGTQHDARDGLTLMTVINPSEYPTLADQVSSHVNTDARLIEGDDTGKYLSTGDDDAPIPNKLSRLIMRVKGWFRDVFRGSVGRHLQRYLNEFVFRLNRWRVRGNIFMMILGRVASAAPLTYSSLTDSRGWLDRRPSSWPRPLVIHADGCTVTSV